MSSASNAMFQNIGNSSSTGLGSMLPTSSVLGSILSQRTTWIIVAGIVLLAIIGYILYYYYIQQESQWLSGRFRAGRGFWDSLADMISARPVTAPPTTEIRIDEDENKKQEPQVDKIPHIRETWCFVGEDLTGRFCVKVPSEQSCDRGRTYESRSECELTPASHMPAGVITQNGAGMLPLSGNTF